MDLQSGKFTATRPGTYFFSFTGWVYFPPATSSAERRLQRVPLLEWQQHRQKSRERDNQQQESFRGTNGNVHHASDAQSKSGRPNRWLIVAYSSSGMVLCGSNVTHFTGFMLQEDISQSIKLLSI
jgi:hypothetical protein